MREILRTTVSGHVQIRDRASGIILLEKENAIQAENMATVIARGLSNAANYSIFKIKFGNRGTYIDSTGQIVFNPPNVAQPAGQGPTANLYNPTYAEIVDDGATGVGVGNSVQFTTIPGTSSTRVIVTCVISPNEAFTNALDINTGTTTVLAGGQIATGTGATQNFASQYFFDELGLFTRAPSETTTAQLNPVDELMLSHLVFSPIEHTGNRELVTVYSLTISVS